MADNGIQQLRQLILAVLAILKTGAAIKATTAGRTPLKMASKAAFPFKKRKQVANPRMMRMGMAILPIMETHTPLCPRNLYPTLVAILTAKMPGMACETTMMSMNSSRSIHFLRSTISFSISGIMAYPPPMVKVPILKKDQNNSYSLGMFILVRAKILFLHRK